MTQSNFAGIVCQMAVHLIVCLEQLDYLSGFGESSQL